MAVARFVHTALTAEPPPGWRTQADHLHRELPGPVAWPPSDPQRAVRHLGSDDQCKPRSRDPRSESTADYLAVSIG
jgi:hypothetical protein